MTVSPEFKVNQPDCDRANSLAVQAVRKAEAGEIPLAISLIEEAIRLDSIAALNGFHSVRDELCRSIGQDAAQKAGEMYNYAFRLKNSGRYRDAEMAYREAAALDPLFLWPLNNLVWMLSTSKDRSVRNGPNAVKCALEVCEKSNWNCWAFLGTLAAAYAEAGDFKRAVGWQQACLEIVPADHRLDSELVLRYFQSGQSYVDEGQPPAAGITDKDGEENVPAPLLRPETNSIHTLQNLFREAYLETETDTDGNLFLIDKFKVLITPSETGEVIALTSVLRPRKHSSLEVTPRIRESDQLRHPVGACSISGRRDHCF